MGTPLPASSRRICRVTFFPAIHDGHLQADEDQIRLLASYDVDGFGAIRGFDDLELADALQSVDQDAPIIQIVLYDQDLLRCHLGESKIRL